MHLGRVWLCGERVGAADPAKLVATCDGGGGCCFHRDLSFWEAKFQPLDDKGAIALLINLAILVVVLIGKWPA